MAGNGNLGVSIFFGISGFLITHILACEYDKKGKVKRVLKERAYEYAPVVSRSHVTRQHITDLIDRLFGGSAESLVMSLIETKHLTPKKLARLQKLIKEQEEKEK